MTEHPTDDAARDLGPLATLQPLVERLRDQVVPDAGVYAGGADADLSEAYLVGIDAAGREYALRFTPAELARWIGQLQTLLRLVQPSPPGACTECSAGRFEPHRPTCSFAWLNDPAPIKTTPPWVSPAVDWWVQELSAPAGPTSTGTYDLAEMGLAAKDRESIVWPDEAQLRIFRGYLAALTQDHNLHQADLVLKTDYDPLGELWQACVEAHIDPRCFPQKTVMRVDEKEIVVSRGYGVPFETIWTDPLWRAAQRGPEYP